MITKRDNNLNLTYVFVSPIVDMSFSQKIFQREDSKVGIFYKHFPTII